MARQHIETDILQQALTAFQRETGIHPEFLLEKHLPPGMYLDGKLRLTGNFPTAEFNVEIKTAINEAILGRIAQHVLTNPEDNILVTRYAPASGEENEGASHPIHGHCRQRFCKQAARLCLHLWQQNG